LSYLELVQARHQLNKEELKKLKNDYTEMMNSPAFKDLEEMEPLLFSFPEARQTRKYKSEVQKDLSARNSWHKEMRKRVETLLTSD
jgi:hypothetical protein